MKEILSLILVIGMGTASAQTFLGVGFSNTQLSERALDDVAEPM